MSGRIDEEEVVRLLRRAGKDVELDVSWVIGVVDGSTQAGPSRTAPSRTTRPDRGQGALRWRGPRRLLAVPLGALLAGGVFVTVHAAVARGPNQDPGRVWVARPSETPSGSTSPPEATLGDAKSITVAPSVPGAGPNPTPTPTTRDTATGVTLTVTSAAARTSYRIPRRGDREWLLVGSSKEGEQRHVPADGVAVGPVQSMGSGQSVSTGPFLLSWGSTAGASSGKSQRWLTVPEAVRGVPAGLRIPVRTLPASGTITLLTGTVKGNGKIKVEVPGSNGPGAVLSQRLPECTGDTACPAVVTITLDKKHAGARGREMMIELSASGPGARVGLAAVELD